MADQGKEMARNDADFAVVGKSMPRQDAKAKVTGALKYIADMECREALHGKVLRSPYPHAFIKKIDTSKAEALPGVAAVVTAKDIPGRNGWGAIVPDQPVVCGDKVRFVGDAVALVAAVDEKTAIKALGLIKVDYEELPAVFSPIDALKSDAPQIHESGNLITTSRVVKGDAEQGFREADVVLERTFVVPFLEHAYLEPDVALAIPGGDGTMTVMAPMQAPFTTRRNVAPVLGLPINRVRCVVTPLGGGFGGKEDSPIDTCVRAAVLAWKTGKPVRIEYTREEIMLSTCKRHPMIIQCKFGAKKDGTFTAVEGTIYNEQGAYASLGPVLPPAGGVHAHAVVMLAGPYEIPNVKVEGYLVYTNHPYGGAMRGFGAPQSNFAHESLVDELADLLKMDPYELRLKNAFKLGSKTATGQVIDQSIGLRETMEETKKLFDWAGKRKPTPDPAQAGSEDKRTGYGMAVGWYRTSIGTSADGCGVNLHLLEDGSVIIYQGLRRDGSGHAHGHRPDRGGSAWRGAGRRPGGGARHRQRPRVGTDGRVPFPHPHGQRHSSCRAADQGVAHALRIGAPRDARGTARGEGTLHLRPGQPRHQAGAERGGPPVHGHGEKDDRPRLVYPAEGHARPEDRPGQPVFRLHVCNADGRGGGGHEDRRGDHEQDRRCL